MNIVANINFYIIFKTITHQARIHLLPFRLTKKGLKYVWIETTHKEMTDLKLKPTYQRGAPRHCKFMLKYMRTAYIATASLIKSTY